MTIVGYMHKSQQNKLIENQDNISEIKSVSNKKGFFCVKYIASYQMVVDRYKNALNLPCTERGGRH